MQSILRTHLIKIGNSQGIQIPKSIIEQFNLTDEVELLVKDGMLVIRSAFHPRANWDAQFQKMVTRGDDAFLDTENCRQL